MQPHVNVARAFQALFDGLRQHSRVAVGADVRDDDRLLFEGAFRFAPRGVAVDGFGHMAVQYRAVAGQDQADVEALDALEGGGHVGLFEGADDAVKVVFERVQIARLVRHGASEDRRVAVVGAEGVAGDEGFVLLDVAEHGVRPVEVGQRHERKRLSAEGKPVPVFDRNAFKVTVDDVLEKPERRGSADDLNVRVQVQQVLDGARVVGLGVADDDVIDRPYIHQARKGRHVLVQEHVLGGLDQGGLFSPLQHVGVVGGAVPGFHDDVKHGKVRVEYAAIGESVRQRECLHRKAPFRTF